MVKDLGFASLKYGWKLHIGRIGVHKHGIECDHDKAKGFLKRVLVILVNRIRSERMVMLYNIRILMALCHRGNEIVICIHRGEKGQHM